MRHAITLSNLQIAAQAGEACLPGPGLTCCTLCVTDSSRDQLGPSSGYLLNYKVLEHNQST